VSLLSTLHGRWQDRFRVDCEYGLETNQGNNAVSNSVHRNAAFYEAPAVKPLLRGRLHQAALVLSIPAGIALVAVATGGVDVKIAAAVYALSLTGLYLSSSVHHLLLGTKHHRPWLRWADHAMIYLLIAGSYTPFCVGVFDRNVGIPLLIAVWTVALAAAAGKLLRREQMRLLGGVLYVGLGGLALIALPELISALTRLEFALIALGGLVYLAGGTVLWKRRPDPWPTVFGFHEVWHSAVIIAAGCHFAAVWLAVS
jgi:hemolysin III